MDRTYAEPEAIDFGDLPEAIDTLLQQGVDAYRRDRDRADGLFRQALAIDPTQLPVYFCLYKIHAYQGDLDEALAVAKAGLKEAAAQAGWPADWRDWPISSPISDGPARFALYTLKALAFIRLRQNQPDAAEEILDVLRRLDPTGGVGWSVVAELRSGLG